jgi:hypothetical protein
MKHLVMAELLMEPSFPLRELCALCVKKAKMIAHAGMSNVPACWVFAGIPIAV